jgi:glycosyltransferase involved in cell wall biosynthesis
MNRTWRGQVTAVPDSESGRVTAVLPSGFRDPLRPSGGNTYDVKLVAGLRRAGWQVTEVTAPDPGPAPSPAALDRLDAALNRIPDGAVVLADGLLTTSAAAAVVPHCGRLAVLVLLHLPRGLPLPGDGRAAEPVRAVADSERQVLAAAAGVITTSRWTARWVARQPELADLAVTVAPPGVDPAPLATGAPPASAAGPNLLFLGRIARHKGIDVLVDALGQLADTAWQCWCVGPSDDPALDANIRDTLAEANLTPRVHLTGTLTGAALRDRMHVTDLLVVPSRFETYGMVITEALARGIPVVATDVGGIREALGRDSANRMPGRLVAPGDPDALAAAIRDWLTSARRRRAWHESAHRRRGDLAGWDNTARIVAGALAGAR